MEIMVLTDSGCGMVRCLSFAAQVSGPDNASSFSSTFCCFSSMQLPPLKAYDLLPYTGIQSWMVSSVILLRTKSALSMQKQR